jgi:hypothetical protein
MSINTIAGTAGTAGTIQPALQAYYDRNLLDRAIPADVHGRFGQVRPLKTRSGNQIKFRRYEALNAGHHLAAGGRRDALPAPRSPPPTSPRRSRSTATTST